jgi:hypothetical protein
MSRVESRDLLHVAHDFTIVDFVDPEGRGPPERQGAGPGLASSPSRRSRYQQDGDKEYRITTTVTDSSTAPRKDFSHASDGVYVPPVSTSTPRYPPAGVSADDDDDDDDDYRDGETYYERQRRKGEGSVKNLPGAVLGGQKSVDVLF